MTTTNEPEHIELTLLEIEHLEIASDRDLSILGLARHMTVNGRGVVGRLIDENRPAGRRRGSGGVKAQPAMMTR